MEHVWTEPDLIAAGTSLLEAGMFGISIYLTVVSGYLVVAYIAGRDLGRFQLFTISMLFVTFSFFASFGSFGLIRGAVNAFAGIDAGFGPTARATFLALPLAILFVQVVGIGLSLKFMMDRRKADQ